MNSLIILESVYRTLIDDMSRHPPESGAIIGVNADCKNVIVTSWLDTIAGSGKISYRPSYEKINEVVADWHSHGITFGGIVHSHRAEYPHLSPADLASANLIMKQNHLEKIILGLFYDNTFDVYYAFQAQEKCASVAKTIMFIHR